MNHSVEVSRTTHNRPISAQGRTIDVFFIAALLFLANVGIDPVVDIPLCDDWAYGWTVEHLLMTGKYWPAQFILPPMITNVLWGALFSLPAGFSYTALHVSTLVASFIGLVGVYIAVRDVERPRWLALIITLTLATNPIYYVLSHTFHTDVLFMALTTWAAVFLARVLRGGSNMQLVVGTAIATAATLSRELALCVPVAFAVASLMRSMRTPGSVLRAFLPLLSSASAFILFRYWLATSGRLPAAVDGKTLELLQAFSDPVRFLTLMFGNSYVVLIYLGLFLLPILILWAWQMSQSDGIKAVLRSRMKELTVLTTLGILAMVVGALVRANYGETFHDYGGTHGPLLPVTGWYLVKTGVGPQLLTGAYGSLDHVHPLPSIFWIVLTALGFVGSLLIILILSVHSLRLLPKVLRREVDDHTDVVGIFLFLCGIIYLLPLLLATLLDDRYLIPSIAFLATAVAIACGNFAASWSLIANAIRSFVLVFLVGFGVIAVSGTRDYLIANRVRWEALTDLMASGIRPEDIDGGFEFFGQYLYEKQYDPGRPQQNQGTARNVPYVVAFGSMPSYSVLRTYSYRNWLPPHVQMIVVLHKE